jgi:hypothetical protein
VVIAFVRRRGQHDRGDGEAAGSWHVVVAGMFRRMETGFIWVRVYWCRC